MFSLRSFFHCKYAKWFLKDIGIDTNINIDIDIDIDTYIDIDIDIDIDTL